MKYVYCHPLFDERKCSHRFSYKLSEAFREKGLILERFDYKGTGESCGPFSEVTIETLRRDLTQQVRKGQTTLIGLRFGASLALDLCCPNTNSVRNLILIEPIVEGCEYVEYLFRKQHIKDLLTQRSSNQLKKNRFYNLEGYKTNEKLIDQIKNFSLKKIAEKLHLQGNIHIVQISAADKVNPEITILADTLKKKCRRVSTESCDLPQFWERVPITDYSILTEKITEYCCD